MLLPITLFLGFVAPAFAGKGNAREANLTARWLRASFDQADLIERTSDFFELFDAKDVQTVRWNCVEFSAIPGRGGIKAAAYEARKGKVEVFRNGKEPEVSLNLNQSGYPENRNVAGVGFSYHMAAGNARDVGVSFRALPPQKEGSPKAVLSEVMASHECAACQKAKCERSIYTSPVLPSPDMAKAYGYCARAEYNH